MSPEIFENLLQIVGPLIQKKPCRSREPIPFGEQLSVALRYLATGNSQLSESFNFRVGRSTVSSIIIKEACDALWIGLKDTYLKPPETMDDRIRIGNEYTIEWNFPNCLGAVDGKHIAIECPKNAGSNYFNYKNFHSMVSMACCDAKYCFTFVGIGSYGRDNDAAIFSETDLFNYFRNQDENSIPEPSDVGGFHCHTHLLVTKFSH